MILIDEGDRNKLTEISKASFPNETAAAIMGKREGETIGSETLLRLKKFSDLLPPSR